MNKKRHKRGNEGAEANAPPKALRNDHAAFCPVHNTLRGKSIVPMRLDTGSTIFAPAKQDAPTATKSVNDPDPLSYARHCPVKTRTRPRAAHAVPLLTATASHVIDMEDTA
nr:hypothetical protein [Tanacetum cinerariifolium]